VSVFADQSFSLGRVVSRTVGVLRTHFLSLWLYNAAIYVVPSVLVGLLSIGYVQSVPTEPFAAFRPERIALSLLGMVVGVVITSVAAGGIIFGTVSALNGRTASFGAMLSRGLATALPLLGVYLLSLIGIYIGLILLLVPGVILALMWAVSGPALVIERTGVLAALQRSRDLTRGHRWAILGLFLVVMVVFWIVEMVLFLLMGINMFSLAAPGASLSVASLMIRTILVGGILGSVINLVFLVGTAVLYFELRGSRDGVGVEALLEVFR
jgi:hypothetical protein